MVSARATPLFARMWAVAIWVHLWNHGLVRFDALTIDAIAAWATFGAAVVTIGSGSVRWLLACAALQLVHVLATLPNVAEHWLLIGFVDAALLVAAARVARRGPLTGEALYRDHAPAARWLLLLGYGAAALAKFNTAFLDPSASCAVYIADLMRVFVPLGPDAPWMDALQIGATLLAEGFVAIALCFPGTRRLGLLAGLGFHFFISFTPATQIFDFTATLFALWVLFLPAGAFHRLALLRDRVAARYAEAIPALRRLAPLGLGAIAAFTAVHTLLPSALNVGVRTMVFDLWGLVVVGVGGWAVWTAPGDSRVPLRLGGAAYGPLLALLLLNVAAPYVGLKSVSSFAMFSNLRTEGGVSNHLFVPAVPVFPYLDDLAVVVASDDPVLGAIAERGGALPMIELRRRIAGSAGDHALTYLHDGREVRLDDPRAALEPPPWPLDRLLISRDVPPTGAPRCQN